MVRQSAWAKVRRDQDVITGADAGDMRTPVLRGVAAVAVVAGLVSGCTGSPSPQPTRPAQTAQTAQNLAGLRDVRPCPGNAGFSCGSLSPMSPRPRAACFSS